MPHAADAVLSCIAVVFSCFLPLKFQRGHVRISSYYLSGRKYKDSLYINVNMKRSFYIRPYVVPGTSFSLNPTFWDKPLLL